MKFACPKCTQRFDVPERFVGREIQCVTCLQMVVVPDPSEAIPTPPDSAAPAPSPADTPAPPRDAAPPAKSAAPPSRKIPPPLAAPLPGPPVSALSPVPPRARGLRDAAALLCGLLVLGAGLFGYVAYRNQESSQQTWRRFTALVGSPTLTLPSPPPSTPPPSTPPPPAQSAAATPPAATQTRLAPAVAATSPADPVAWLANHRSRWPKTVALAAAQDFSAIYDGKVVGSTQAPAGAVVTIFNITPKEVVVVAPDGGSTKSLSPGATNLPELARREMARPVEPRPVPAAIPPAFAPPLPVAVATPPPGASVPSTLPAPESTPFTSLFGSVVPPPVEMDEPPANVQAEERSPTPASPPRPTRSTAGPFPAAGSRLAMTVDAATQSSDPLSNRHVVLTGNGTLRLTAGGDPLPGSVVNLTSPDAWLVLDKVPASTALADLFDRLWVNGAPAELGVNARIVQYGSGCAIIPHGPDFAAMQVFGGSSLGGAALPLRCGVKYDAGSLGASVGSFRLKRGYMATLAQEENGTGFSKNYVAQDHDLEVRQLPAEFGSKVGFVRVFPWRWTNKKGVAGGIWQNLNVGWYYDWNISHHSTPELEYVPIRQNRWWPPLNQDWLARGSTHLLGYNEPDHKDQSNLTVGDALAGWPDLLGTGLRLGSPAVSDGGLKWLYEFMEKADAAHLRVDFVAVHYYRAVNNPSDARGAAAQFYNFLREIHDRTHRPIWVTEWNNGANWTGHKPTYEQETAAIGEMVRMLDQTPFVERYAIYNWVQDERNVQRKDGTLTAAGEAYRDDAAPPSYVQARP